MRVLSACVATLEEFGDMVEAYAAEVFLGDIANARGQHDAALKHYEKGRSLVLEHGGYLPEAHRRLAEAHLALGNLEQANHHAEEAVRLVIPDDMYSMASTRTDLGLVRERQGRLGEAEALLREAMEFLGRTEYNGWEQQMWLAVFLLRQGRAEEGRAELADALRRASSYGPESELPDYVSRVAAAAAAAGGVEL